MNLPVIGIEQTSCGECTACCHVMAVRELGKPCNTTCKSLSKAGCSIYEQRPPTCGQFYCLYRLGEFGPDIENRPDKLGFLLARGTINNDKSCDVYQYAPTLDPANRERVNRLVAEFRARHPDVVGVNIFPYNAKIGLDIDLNPPYPTETQHMKNLFRRIQDDVWLHLGPEKSPDSARERLAPAGSTEAPKAS